MRLSARRGTNPRTETTMTSTRAKERVPETSEAPLVIESVPREVTRETSDIEITRGRETGADRRVVVAHDLVTSGQSRAISARDPVALNHHCPSFNRNSLTCQKARKQQLLLLLPPRLSLRRSRQRFPDRSLQLKLLLNQSPKVPFPQRSDATVPALAARATPHPNAKLRRLNHRKCDTIERRSRNRARRSVSRNEPTDELTDELIAHDLPHEDGKALYP